MSSKTGAKAWSMVGRMAAWCAGSAAVLLVVATTSLYVTIAASLEAEGDQWLGYSIIYFEEIPAPDWPPTRTGRSAGR